jgi:hypothetical protein
MTNSNPKHEILLGPTEKISKELITQILEMNEGKPEFQTYKKRIRNVFHLKERVITEKICYFLAGFIEGEGSISISIKKNPNAKFGIELDPLFNLTQHVNGVNHLYLALVMFQTGRIRYKSGSNATLVLIIEPRKSLQEKVCPYFEKYIYPLSSPAKQIRYKSFKKMLDLFDQKAHLDKNRFINEMLPIWDSMRVQINNKAQTFSSLEEAQKYAANF